MDVFLECVLDVLGGIVVGRRHNGARGVVFPACQAGRIAAMPGRLARVSL
jgi:hypothetical protein